MNRKIIKLRDKPKEPDKASYYVTVLEDDDFYPTNIKTILKAFADEGITDTEKMWFKYEEEVASDSYYGRPGEDSYVEFYYFKEADWDRDIAAYNSALAAYETWLVEKSDKIKKEKARQKQERKDAKEAQKKRRLANKIEEKKQELARLQEQNK